MAVPKRMTSKSKTRSRKANWKLSHSWSERVPAVPRMKLDHRVCKNCGYYDGKRVVAVDAKK